MAGTRVNIPLSPLTINGTFISCEIAIWKPWTWLFSWEAIHALWQREWILIMFVIAECHSIFPSALSSSTEKLSCTGSLRFSVNISDLNPSQFLIAIHLKLHLLHGQRHTCMVPVSECQHLIFRLLGKPDPDSVWVIDVLTPTLGIGIEQKITTIHKLDLLIIRPCQMRTDSIQLGFEWRLHTRGPGTFGPKVQFIWLVWTQPFLACARLKR